MDKSGIILTVSIVAIIMLVIWVVTILMARRARLPRTPEGEKPAWMRTTPPPETTAATQAEGEGITLYNYDQGENLAAPFAEQIEDILKSQMSADPYLRSYEIDLGTGQDGSLQIRVGDKLYTGIEQIPDLRLREAFTQAVAKYNQRGK